MSPHPSSSATKNITLPHDQYGHKDAQGNPAPTEWWWHVGTLKSADGRLFGFEVNAAGFNSAVSYAFSQLSITDVSRQKHYEKVNPVMPCPSDWAQYDTEKPWYVRLPAANGSTAGAVSMQALAPDSTPLNMHVVASFADKGDQTECRIDLQLQQQGPPLIVWGTGCHLVNPEGKTPLSRNNYYYSLTNLQATGTLTIGEETIAVTGLAWMDHEYGAFPNGSPSNPVQWVLQDLQLANGIHLSNYSKVGETPAIDKPIASNATILVPGQDSCFVDTTTTPMGPVYISAKNVTYFLRFKVEITDPQSPITGTFYVNSLCPDQVLISLEATQQDVYEGVGTCEAHLAGSSTPVSGTAWIEQNLPNPHPAQ